MKVLSIPIKLNGLYVTNKVKSAIASADFRRTPFFNKEGIAENVTTPFISENLVTQPFNADNTLATGVHLHFDIPITLKTPQKLNNADEEAYPPLPNRWLIIKNNEPKWIIESDYLWSEESDSLEKKKAVNVLLPKEGMTAGDYSRCRHVGRYWDFDNYQKETTPKYWKDYFGGQGITAIGYGEPTFVGYYQNCKSVFGFHDAIGKQDDTYEIIGWYANKADLDCILDSFKQNEDFYKHLYFKDAATFEADKENIIALGKQAEQSNEEFKLKYAKYLFLYQEGIKSKTPTFEELKALETSYNQVKAFENAFEWTYADNAEQLILPEQLLFISKIKIQAGSEVTTNHQIENAEIAIGNTGREALNALLAKDLHQEDNTKSKAEIEHNLELIHMSEIVDKQLDLEYKFAEERHQKSFSPIEGGKLWQLEVDLQKSDNFSNDNEVNQSFSNLLKEPDIRSIHTTLLEKTTLLNQLKLQYNQIERNVQSKQHQLFADWYKYMIAAHPPVHDADSYLRADDILRFINRFVIQDIFDDVQHLDIFEDDVRKTIAGFGLNANLDLAILKTIAKKFTTSDNSILGQILNLFFKSTSDASHSFHHALEEFKPILKDRIAIIKTFKDQVDLVFSTIAIYTKAKIDKDFSTQNTVVTTLDSFYQLVTAAKKWQTNHTQVTDFSSLKSFLKTIQIKIKGLNEDNQKAIHSSVLRFNSIHNSLEKIERDYNNRAVLERPDLNKLLQLIIKYTNSITIQKQIDSLIDDENSSLSEIRLLLETNLFSTINDEIRNAIDLISTTYNITAFEEKTTSLITQENQQLTTYFYPQIDHHFTQAQLEIDLFSSKINDENSKQELVKSIQSISGFKVKLTDKSLTNVDIETTLKSLTDAAIYLDTFAIVEVKSDFQKDKSIVQLLEDLEKSIQQTIENIYEEKQTAKGKERVKKYANLIGRPINMQLSLNAEPRYYQAKEPVLLLRADNLVGQLPTAERTEAYNYDKVHLTTFPNFEFNTIIGFNTNDIFKNLPILSLEKPFWNPSFLEWQIEYIPVNDPSETKEYNADYISKGFVLNDDKLDLQFQNEAEFLKLAKKTTRIYSSSTILSPHAIDIVNKKVTEYKSQEGLESRGLTDSNDFSDIDDLLEELTGEAPTLKARGIESQTSLEELQERSSKLIEVQSNPALALTKTTQISTVQKKIQLRKFDLLQGSINTVFDKINLKSRDALSSPKAILSQSLGGFNQCLLMRKQTMQLEIDDPVALTDYLPLIQTIRDFIGEEIHAAPEPQHFFNPIRSGLMRVSKLRIIDTFGQFADANFPKTEKDTTSKLVTSETLNAFKTGQSTSLAKTGFDAYLPTRVVQPLRLNLRWVANNAKGENAENAHNSPICGWIVPNFLNQTFAIFNQAGELLGDVGIVKDANDVKKVRLLPKPGAHSFYDFEITNTHLRNLTNDFLQKGADYFLKFLQNINEITLYNDPEGFERHTELAMLVGKPLAVVRGKIGFQAMEMYAINQDWGVFEKDLRNAVSETYKRDSYNFEQVKFPIKMGHLQQLNDGLFGFWEDGNSTFQPVMKTDNQFQKNTLEKSISESATLLTMLFDPRGKLNAYTGILPTKTITIPESMYADALTKMKIYFSIGPLITPKDKLQIPIPRSAIFEWKWVYESDYSLTEISTKPSIKKATFELLWKQQFDYNGTTIWNLLLTNNWLGKIPDDSTIAYVNFDDKTRLPLPNIPGIETDWASIADNILKEYYQGIAPVNTDVQFGQVELREGWLKLMNEL